MAGGRHILGRSLDSEAFLDGSYHKKWQKNHLTSAIHPQKRRQEVYSLHPEAEFFFFGGGFGMMLFW